MVGQYLVAHWRSLVWAAAILGALVLMASAVGRADYIYPTPPHP